MGDFGYSNTGYDGTYTTAITMDGGIVADFITAGILRLGGLDDSTILEIYNAAGDLIGGWNNTGLYADAGTIGGWTIDSQGLTNGTLRINHDGSSTIYTVADVLILRNYLKYKGGDTSYIAWNMTGSMLAHYDLTGDGQVTSLDYVRLKNLIGLDPG